MKEFLFAWFIISVIAVALLFGINAVSVSVTDQAKEDAERFSQMSRSLSVLGADHIQTSDSAGVYAAVFRLRKGITIEGTPLNGEVFVFACSIGRALRALYDLEVNHIHANDLDGIKQAIDTLRRGIEVEDGQMVGEVYMFPVNDRRAFRAASLLRVVKNKNFGFFRFDLAESGQ